MESIKKHIIINASTEDYANISKLFYSSKTQYFGRHRRKDSLRELFFRDHITHRLLVPMTAARYINIGYAEIANTPNMPALSADLWLDFINFHYCCNLPLSATNACFLNKFVYHKDYIPEMLKQILAEVFYRENKLKYILVWECPDYRRYLGKDVRNYSCLKGISQIFYPKCFSSLTCPNTQKLHVIMRDRILPSISYRKALAEDNDDIIDVINHDSPMLKNQLGDYYIAEELLSAESKSSLIAAEINDITAGFIWLNENIDLLTLLENFNLQQFGNLLKFNGKERFKEKVLTINSVHKRPFRKLFTTEEVNKFYFNESDLSLCSGQMRSDEEDLKEAHHKSVVLCWRKLNERLKSTNYYIHLREEHLKLFHNIEHGDTNASWEARANAFVIELLGLLIAFDIRRVFEFLLAAFTVYPDKDYCLLSISASDQTTPVYLEILKYFIPVTFRPKFYAEQHLFITHRSAIYGDLNLFPARPNDADDIIKLLMQDEGQMYPLTKRVNTSRISTIASRFTFKTHLLPDTDSYDEPAVNRCNLKRMRDILENIFEDYQSVYRCFTIRCGDSKRSIDDNKVVGFVLIRPFILSNFLRKHFHTLKMDELQNFHKAEIITFRLHPFFHFQSDFVFRELSRQTNYFCFYYLQATDRHNSPNDLVKRMQPLEPRRIKNLWLNYLGDAIENKLDEMDLLNDQFAVFKTNLKPTAYFGSVKNIVVLGYTDICKAFLRLMIFGWHHLSHDNQATINCVPELNITVICSPGVMEAEHEYAFACEACAKDMEESCWINFKNSDAFLRDVCERMNVRTWIKFVSGKISSIDGQKKVITMKSECEIYYEIFVLMCGMDYGVPPGIFLSSERPFNYAHFNNRFDKILFYHKLRALQNNCLPTVHKSIVVYGSHLRAFEFVNFLLQHYIKGHEIHLVRSKYKDAEQLNLILNISTEDTRIEETLVDMLQDLGVQVYDQMYISGCKLRDKESNVQEVMFKKCISEEEVTFECDFFISFYEVYLPRSLLDIFTAANIEIDNNCVIVNASYQTSVQDIYAIGNFIKHEMEPNHQYRFVDPQEAAEKIINILDIFVSDKPTEEKFSKVCYFQAQLPLNNFLVKVIIPKRYLANHLNNEYEIPLVTYNNGDFSRVRLNEWDIVEEIVIVTKKKMDYDFLKCLCGRHELLLNNLKRHWHLKEIVNFVDFFQESWTELLMHEEFENLRAINKNLIIETAQEVLKKDISRADRSKLLYSQCLSLGITAEMEYTFSEFIRNHLEDFVTELALPDDFIPRTSKKPQV